MATYLILGALLGATFLFGGLVAYGAYRMCPLRVTHLVMKIQGAPFAKRLLLQGCANRKMCRRLDPVQVAVGFLGEVHNAEVALRIAALFSKEANPGQRRKFANHIQEHIAVHLRDNTWNDTLEELALIIGTLQKVGFPIKEELAYARLVQRDRRDVSRAQNANPNNLFSRTTPPDLQEAHGKVLGKRARITKARRKVTSGPLRNVGIKPAPSREG